MSGLDAVARRVQAAYADAPKRERLHVAGRLRSCPIAAVAAATPARGRILDFGCGHGAVTLYLALSSPDRMMSGCDIDTDKIALAQRAAARANAAVDFDTVDHDYRPSGEWDAITIVDVLYLLGEEVAMDVVDHAAAALAPGGVLVIKELDVRPRWKYWFGFGQEVLATKVVRITEGANLHIIPPTLIGDRLEAAGLRVEQRSLQRGRLHPHHLIVASR